MRRKEREREAEREKGAIGYGAKRAFMELFQRSESGSSNGTFLARVRRAGSGRRAFDRCIRPKQVLYALFRKPLGIVWLDVLPRGLNNDAH